MKNTKIASLEDIRAMQVRGDIARPKKDVPERDMPEDFWDSATPQKPKTKQQVNMRVDPDILDFFKGDDGKGHLVKMHAVLRSYVDAQRKRHRQS